MKLPYPVDGPASGTPAGPVDCDRVYPPRPSTTVASLVTLVALAVMAVACSSAPKSPGVAGGGPLNNKNAASPGGPRSPGALAEMMSYAHCMRSHGILAFPDPTPNPGGPGGSFSWSGGGKDGDLEPNDPRYQAANKTCQTLLPDGGQIPTASAKQLAADVAMAACLRSHGVPNFPDPNGQGAFDLSDVDRSTPQFQKAFNTCISITGFKGPMGVYSAPARP